MTWTALGESVTGTSHRARNTPCQDAFRFRTFGPSAEWLVIVAADGAGSASHSEIGATFACDEFVRRVEARENNMPRNLDDIASLFADVRNALCAEAERLAVRPREVACTSLLAIIGPDSAAFAQIGDGAIVVGDGQSHRTVFWPEPAEYANATDFLTDDRFADFIRFETSTDSIVEVAAFTDGLQRLALDFAARTAYPAFFSQLFNELRNAIDPQVLAGPFRDFLDSQRVNERTDDDKTLVLAVRHP
jgi:Protein phosphatase 2C